MMYNVWHCDFYIDITIEYIVKADSEEDAVKSVLSSRKKSGLKFIQEWDCNLVKWDDDEVFFVC